MGKQENRLRQEMRTYRRALLIIITALLTTVATAQNALETIVEANNPTAAASSPDSIAEKPAPADQVITSEQLPDFSYETPRTYEIEEITVSGKNNYDDFVLIGYSGLKKGERIMIPGDDITNVIRRFWNQGLFSNIKVEVVSIRGNKVWININLDQRPKVSRINFMGVKKKEREELISRLTREMKSAAKMLEFEHAAFLRDEIKKLKGE